MKRQAICGLISLAAFASAALAQQSQPSQDQGGNGQQRRQPQGRQGGGLGQRGPRGGMMGMNLPESLKLTEEQKTKVQEIQQNVRQEMRQQQGGAPMTPEDRQKMMDLGRQIRTAAQAGDEGKVAELQNQLDNSAFTQSRKQMQERIDSQIAQVLTGGQRRQFDQYKRLRDSGLPPQLIDQPQALKDAALKIKTLSDVQKNGIEAAYERYDRGSAHADDLTKSTLAEQFANEVLATLKPSQKVLLTSQAMGGPGGPGGRQGRGGGRNGAGNGAGAPADPNAPAAGGNGTGAAPAAPQTPPANQ